MCFNHFYYFISSAGMECGDSVTPDKEEYTPTEGSSVSLRCTYETSSNYVYLYWYRHYPNQAPQFLLYKGARSQSGNITPGFTLNHDKNAKRTDLKISSAEVTDSAMYFCALRPTVTGNPETLYKNLTSPEKTFLLCS
uniref:Ig-like domain-containing protein n=1 Tax=Oncorhynchus tshawytscha TaxID=74940 RepID=A0A8C8J1R7_ONCTS